MAISSTKLTNLSTAKEGDLCDFICLVQKTCSRREVEMTCNGNIRRTSVTSILVGDPSLSFSKISMWDEKADLVYKQNNEIILPGDCIFVNNIRIKSFREKLEGNSTISTKILCVWRSNQFKHDCGISFSLLSPLLSWTRSQFPNFCSLNTSSSVTIDYHNIRDIHENMVVNLLGRIEYISKDSHGYHINLNLPSSYTLDLPVTKSCLLDIRQVVVQQNPLNQFMELYPTNKSTFILKEKKKTTKILLNQHKVKKMRKKRFCDSFEDFSSLSSDTYFVIKVSVLSIRIKNKLRHEELLFSQENPLTEENLVNDFIEILDDTNAIYRTFSLIVKDKNGEIMKLELEDDRIEILMAYITANMIVFPQDYPILPFDPAQQVVKLLNKLLESKDTLFTIEIQLTLQNTWKLYSLI